MTKNFFEVKNVDFKVGGKTKVKNVSFSIKNEGDVVCLLGPSGIGKTTILRTIAGLEKINNGSIELNNKTLSSKTINVEPENRNISLAFQDNSLFPHYTVEKNILLGAERNKGKSDKKIGFYGGGGLICHLAKIQKDSRFFDGDEAKWGSKWMPGLSNIENPQNLLTYEVDHLIICVEHYAPEILKYLDKQKIVNQKMKIHLLAEL